jgi:hypothetical protein
LGWRYSNHRGHYAISSVNRSSFLYPYNTRLTAICEAQRNNPILYKWLACDLTLMIKTRCPAVEYPLWDENWDGGQTQQQAAGGGEEQRRIRKEGVTRYHTNTAWTGKNFRASKY